MQVLRLNTVFKNSYDKEVVTPMGIQPLTLFDARLTAQDSDWGDVLSFDSIGTANQFNSSVASSIKPYRNNMFSLDVNQESAFRSVGTDILYDGPIVMTAAVMNISDQSFNETGAGRILGVGNSTANRCYLQLTQNGIIANAGAGSNGHKVGERSQILQVITVIFDGVDSAYINNNSDIVNISLPEITSTNTSIGVNTKGVTGNAEYSFEMLNFSIWLGSIAMDKVESYHRNIFQQMSLSV